MTPPGAVLARVSTVPPGRATLGLDLQLGRDDSMGRQYSRTATAVAALAIAVTLLGCSGDTAGGADQGNRPPDILLISIDTLRADHLGAYGYSRPTSPHLDRFAAEEAILFEEVLNTGGGTLPVHVSMFTSLLPGVHQVWSESGNVLAPARVTLAEQLSAAGYATAAFTGGGFTLGKFGLSQGFDTYDDAGGDFLKIMPKARQWLAERPEQPFFLFLHTYDVHSDWKSLPYDAPEDFNERFTQGYSGDFTGCMFGVCASELLATLNKRRTGGGPDLRELFTEEDLAYMVGLYDGGISYVDRELRRLFDYMKELGIYDRALVVVTSDHGEEFLEHGLFLHHQNFEEVARVPLLLKLPGGRGGGRRVPGQVTTLEVMPTVLDLVGIEPNPEIQGRSLLPIVGGSLPARELVYIGGGLEKLRTAQWSVLFNQQGPVRLYDLRTDPGERRDVLSRHRELATSFHQQYREIQDQQRVARERLAAASADGPEVGLTPEEVERLRSLGYLN